MPALGPTATSAAEATAPYALSPRALNGDDAQAVLGKAATRAAERLGQSRSWLAQVLGVSPATITRLYAGSYQLQPQRKEWEFALLFVRAFRSLDSIVGDEASARRWLASPNLALGGVPAVLMTTTEGLVRVVHYLDASRAVV
ncbi:DUF2384 domain-containing protein [Ideonella sp. 4Y16]|uniref:DUF2384 domain-containing protein n=1 Tax=Ideonella alba TaxID=2824118 RepID=A0A940Y779_9BURK|nr:MbcA/ParS/Xre antitoxin family protein [Ideonella alba]MBQ0931147.1 DUF2384 domain-containing protein [Ideonella alba]MBQ0944298.1 DUF2384 domain-containing protein [Ideonella alba]